MWSKRLLSLAVALPLLVGACGSDSAPRASADRDGKAPAARWLEWTGADAAFYQPPDLKRGGKHGDLLRYQVLEPVPGGSVYKVLYRSVSVQGAPIAVSGLVVVPDAAGADRVVLTWAHGTTGLADQCAPSKAPLDPRLDVFLQRGWVVAATDYEGLGTPGLHPYIAGISEGRGTLDIVRAAKQLPRSKAGNRTLIWGHSQGGHAALFASQLAAKWTPELHVLGTVAGAPATELPLIATALKGGDFQGYLAMAAGGLHAAYPDADLSLILTPKGISGLHVLDEGCTAEVFAAYNHVPYDEFAKADPMSVEPWKTVMMENDPGHVKVDSPLLIIHGEADQQIPPVASKLLFDRLCGLGQVVERRTYPGQGHAEVIGPSMPDMLAWMDARVAGTPATSGCPATPAG